MTKVFVLPDLGEGIAEAQIIRVLVSEGESIAEDQYLMEVETDKAAVEIPSPFAGKVQQVHVKDGQTVNVGEVVFTFEDSGSAAAAVATQEAVTPTKTAPTISSTPMAATSAPSATAPIPRKTNSAAAPAVRKFAREKGIDLDAVTGTGAGGRITKSDVENALAGDGAVTQTSTAAMSRVSAAPVGIPAGESGSDNWGTTCRVPLSQIRKTIAKQMSRSAFTAVHVTHNDDVDITELDLIRRELNEATGNDPKLTLMAFVIRALCLALKKYPIFNASLEEDLGAVIYKEYINIGIAVDTERGLVVPVIRQADQLTLRGIAHELRLLADRIRNNQFSVEDLRGGTFTITNVGALGGMVSTPIINYPEVAILGLGRSRKVPAIHDGELAEALKLPMNLSFDHRATDGADAARFAGEIISYLETPARFMLD